MTSSETISNTPGAMRLPGTADSAPFLCLMVTAALLTSLFASKVFTLAFLSLALVLLFLNAQEPSRSSIAGSGVKQLWIALGLPLAYIFLSSFWSNDPGFSLLAAGKLLILLLVGSLAVSPHFSRHILATWTTRLAGAAWLRPLVLIVAVVTLAGAAFDSLFQPNAVPLLSDVYKLLATAFPLLWILAACLGADLRKSWLVLWLIALIFLSGEHVVGPLAFALTALVLPVAAHFRRPEWIVPMAALAASSIIILAAIYFQSQGGPVVEGDRNAGALSELLARVNAGDRQMIWLQAFRVFQEEPWFGHGFRMSRFILEAGTGGNPPAHILHPHNFTLQILMEVGILGMLVIYTGFSLAWVKLLSWMNPQGVQLATGLGFCLLVVWSAGFGVWQSYLLGAFISGLTLIRLCFPSAPTSAPQGAQPK
ncbi:O-antigen ligase family protein [Limibacillus sp. MBR-115]|uniref:O-antigen ligase family protein n=1 Tax=Limibacillus sp. MBR-115 TaxID=3156465 RepID=UPI0033919841